MKYSVVIPLYNHARYIEAAIRSVQSQTLAPEEIIVIDDGSSDDGFEKVIALAGQDSRISCWNQPNRGAHFTINSGLHRATSEVLTILNSDDIYAPERMERCIGLLNERPEIGAVYTQLESIDDRGAVVPNQWYVNACKDAGAAADLAVALLNANFLMTTSNLVIRRSALTSAGYFSSLRYAHDLEFFTRFLRRGGRFGSIDEPLLRYRVHSGNTISESHRKVRVEWAFVVAWHARQITLGGASMESQAGILDLVERHELGRLVQWMTWFCEQSVRDGFDPFEHPDWEDALGLALGVEK